MQPQLRDGLPFCQVVVSYKQKQIVISNVLIDTGSARTIFSADVLRDIGITPQPNDVLEVVRGVGGSELVYTRSVDFVQIESRQVAPFLIEVGAMDYGFSINGILGMDLLRQAGVILNLRRLVIDFAESS